MRTVSCVIITRHRPEMVHECLENLDRERDAALDAVVVDNSDVGRRDTRDIVERFPWCQYVFTGPCKSFQTATRNQGALMSSGEIIAYLDDDSMVQPGWLAACRAAYDDPTVGAAGGVIMDIDVAELDHKRKAPVCRILPNGALTDNCDCETDGPIDVHHLRGCNLSIRRDVFLRAGRFDEHLLGYGWQDLDLLTRARQLGYRIVHHPPMRVYHKLHPRLQDGRSSVSYSKRCGLQTNLTYVYAKNSGPWSKLFFRFLFTYQTMFYAIFRRPSWVVLKLGVASMHGKIRGLIRYLCAAPRLKANGEIIRLLHKATSCPLSTYPYPCARISSSGRRK